MTEVSFTYKEKDLAWVSDDIVITGKTVLLVRLGESGRIVIKKRNDLTGASPKVLVSTQEKDFAITIDSNKEGRIINVCASSIPLYIRYQKL